MGKVMLNGREYISSTGLLPECYSTEERTIGTWADGKPLYQKTIVKTNITKSTGSNILITKAEINSDLEKIRYINGYIGIIPINSNIDGSDGLVQVWGDTDIYYHFNWYNTSQTAIITVRYTKTTDTPGSGTYTPNGTLSHHYSTTEHIIGTWIDGKPLYEKTVVDTTSRSSGTNYLGTNISNLSEVIDMKGYISYGADESFLTIPFSDDPASSITNSVIKFSGIYIPNATITFYAGADFNGSNAINKVVVTLQYTKTTD